MNNILDNIDKIKNRFWQYIENTSFLTDEDCWNWIGSRRGKNGGYGLMKYTLNRGNQIHLSAHAVSFFLHKDLSFNILTYIQSNIYVCHKCDNPSCVNPNHLFLGSSSANAKDAFSKGRRNATDSAKLTKDQVLKIRVECQKEDYNKYELAKIYNIDESTIRAIKYFKTWKNL